MKATRIAAATLCLLFAAPAFCQEAGAPEERFIEVTGTGAVTFQPEAFTLVFMVEDQSSSAADSLKVCTERIRTVTRDLKALDVPGLTLTQGPPLFFATSFQDPNRGERPQVTCRIELAASLVMKPEGVSPGTTSAALIDAAGQSGAYPVMNPAGSGHLFLSTTQVNEHAKEALSDAVDNAVARAAALAAKVGKELGHVLFLREKQGPTGPDEGDSAFASTFCSRPPGETWTLVQGKVQWRKSVTVRFRMKEKE